MQCVDVGQTGPSLSPQSIRIYHSPLSPARSQTQPSPCCSLQFSCNKLRTELRVWRLGQGLCSGPDLRVATSGWRSRRRCWQPWGSWQERADWWSPPRSRGWSARCWGDTAGSPPPCSAGGQTGREAGTGLAPLAGHNREDGLCPRPRTSPPCWTPRRTARTEPSPGWRARHSYRVTDLDGGDRLGKQSQRIHRDLQSSLMPELRQHCVWLYGCSDSSIKSSICLLAVLNTILVLGSPTPAEFTPET